jgi:hypothetical protein
MPNHLDFLFELDRHTRESSLGAISPAFEMHTIARGAGLVDDGDISAARWTGELVELGYVRPGPAMGGTTRAIPPGTSWSDADLQLFTDYRITDKGRDEADRIRRLKREAATDAAMGLQLARLDHAWMSDEQTRAINEVLVTLRAALDDERSSAAIGAAKDLLESACKITIERAGETSSAHASLVALFKDAHRYVAATDAADTALGRSMSATVQRVAELRNAVGAGHGHAELRLIGMREALLTASAASAIAAYLLNAP